MTRTIAHTTATILALFGTATMGCGAAKHSAPMSHASAPYYAAEAAPAGPDVAGADVSGESYEALADNKSQTTALQPVSTFSIDVDTASYSNVRRFLTQGQLPPRDAVRIEELVNYFDYAYPQPEGDAPFSVTAEVAPAPWNPDRKLVHIGLQGRSIAADALPPRNLVFLLDVSGSMHAGNKLPLLKQALALLVDQMSERDRVAIVVYAGASGMVLAPTPGNDKHAILGAVERLQAGGSTNGAAGIELAYALAQQNFDPNAINRVILATDGDFNVGVTNRGELVRLIEKKREQGVYLTVLGFGMGNLKDATMEKLADKGNGNYAYIDSIDEARKVLVSEAGSTLITIAKDVKIQVAFNPALVASYRLIGYENRVLENRDFDDDKKDAGEIGAGHTVTALYEIALSDDAAGMDADASMMTVKLRYKMPGSNTSVPMQFDVRAGSETPAEATSEDFRFSAAVAAFGMLLRDVAPEYRGSASFAQVKELAMGALGRDAHGYRRQFLGLVDTAERLSGTTHRAAQAF